MAEKKNKNQSPEGIISTSSLNDKGTRILTEGIDLGQFKKNPVILYMHERGNVIGRIEDIRIEDDKLIGRPVFDETDEFALKIKKKWDNDFLRMFSGSFKPIELSDAPEHILEGQTYMTVSKSKLIEVSIVDMGSNDDALQLIDDNGELLKLSKNGASDIPLLKLKGTNQSKNLNTELTMNENSLSLLGLTQGASQEQIDQAILNLAKENESLKATLVAQEVEGAIKLGRITEEGKEHFLKLGKTNGLEDLKLTLSAIPVQERKPAEAVPARPNITLGAQSDNAGEKKWGQMTEAELLQLKATDLEAYKLAYREHYGFECEL